MMRANTKEWIKAWIIAVLVVVAIVYTHPTHSAATFTALYTGEKPDGRVTQCFYEYAGDTYVYTVPPYRTCPMSIEVEV